MARRVPPPKRVDPPTSDYRKKYERQYCDWDKYTDGSYWELKRMEDFLQKSAAHAEKAAKRFGERYGWKVTTTVHDHDTLTVRFLPKKVKR